MPSANENKAIKITVIDIPLDRVCFPSNTPWPRGLKNGVHLAHHKICGDTDPSDNIDEV